MYKKIMVGFDGSKFANKALREAADMAKASGGKIFLVSVVDVTLEFEALAPGLTDKFSASAKRLLDKVSAKIASAGISVEKEVHVGDPYEVIVNAAKKKKADVIILGSHGRTGLSRLLMGSVTAKVVGHAPCAVLVVRP